MDTPRHSAQVYWFWESEQCLPIYFLGKLSGQYYRITKSELAFNCRDSQCEKCHYTGIRIAGDGDCHRLGEKTSYHQGTPDINKWHGNETTREYMISNTFYSGEDKSCSLNMTYIQPQWLSTHVNVGLNSKSNTCKETNNNMQECRGKPCANCGCIMQKGWIFHIYQRSINTS